MSNFLGLRVNDNDAITISELKLKFTSSRDHESRIVGILEHFRASRFSVLAYLLCSHLIMILSMRIFGRERLGQRPAIPLESI